jgi:hypothetical protein
VLRKRSPLTGLLASSLSVAAITIMIYGLREFVPVVSTGVVYTLAVLFVPARTSTSDGFDPADVAWLLENAPGEVLVLRTGEAVRAPHLSVEAT